MFAGDANSAGGHNDDDDEQCGGEKARCADVCGADVLDDCKPRRWARSSHAADKLNGCFCLSPRYPWSGPPVPSVSDLVPAQLLMTVSAHLFDQVTSELAKALTARHPQSATLKRTCERPSPSSCRMPVPRWATRSPPTTRYVSSTVKHAWTGL